MTIEQIIGLVLALLLMGIGAIGSLLPGIPGVPLVLVAAIGHRWYFGLHSASNWVLAVLTGLVVLSLLVDYLGSVLGAKKLGASWRGVVGSIVGMIAGVFFGFPGLILGPFVGAALFELAGGRDWAVATRAGVGAILGMLLGSLGKMVCCFTMMALFTMSTIANSKPASLGQLAADFLACLAL